MIRIQLDDATRDGLVALRRTGLPPQARDRIEMVTLSDAGWSPPRIAAHLGCHPLTVRDALRALAARGAAALYPFRSGPAPDAERRDLVAGALRGLLAEERAWTSRQLSEALAARGIALEPRQVVVLDNAGLRTSKVIRRARRAPAAAGTYLEFLPPYMPELNEIEPVFRQVKFHEIPERSHSTRLGLREAVEEGFTGYGRRLRPKRAERLRPAAYVDCISPCGGCGAVNLPDLGAGNGSGEYQI